MKKICQKVLFIRRWRIFAEVSAECAHMIPFHNQNQRNQTEHIKKPVDLNIWLLKCTLQRLQGRPVQLPVQTNWIVSAGPFNIHAVPVQEHSWEIDAWNEVHQKLLQLVAVGSFQLVINGPFFLADLLIHGLIGQQRSFLQPGRIPRGWRRCVDKSQLVHLL